MTRDVLDDRLIGALHVRALSRAGLHHDPAASHALVQAGTIAALIDGRYDGDLSLGELLTRGDLGIGTIQHLDGELVIVDGDAWVAHGDGTVTAVTPVDQDPVRGGVPISPGRRTRAHGPDRLHRAHRGPRRHRADRRARGRGPRRRRVPRPPSAQRARAASRRTRRCARSCRTRREWTVDQAHGSVIGFRFPDATSGIEVAGYHLHFLSDDRHVGGHVLDLVVASTRSRASTARTICRWRYPTGSRSVSRARSVTRSPRSKDRRRSTLAEVVT